MNDDNNKIEEHAKRLVESWPALTDQQVLTLSALFAANVTPKATDAADTSGRAA